ncbi:hypothetical protein ACFYRG_51590 [Streptomyces mirabilis]
MASAQSVQLAPHPVTEGLRVSGAIIQTGTDSYRLAHTKAHAQESASS